MSTALVEAVVANITTWLGTLPNTTTNLIIDIGTNTDPQMPGPGYAVLGFEPVVHELIEKRHRHLHVARAAVSADDGVATMRVMGMQSRSRPSMSSSLSDGAAGASGGWNGWAVPRRRVQVAVLSLSRLLLELLPPRLTVWLLKTDMQGHDYGALASAPRAALRRAHYVQAEASLFGVPSFASPRGNDFCAQHVPLLQAAGFELHALRSSWAYKHVLHGPNATADACRAGVGWLAANTSTLRIGRDNEADGHWRRADTPLPRPPVSWPCKRQKGMC